MEQLVARWAHNPKAVGSSPAPATSNPETPNFTRISGFFKFTTAPRLRPY